MKKMSLVVIAALAGGFLGTSMAQDKSGYWVDGSGNFVRNGSGTCMRSGSWSPAIAIPECDGTAAVAVAPTEKAATAAQKPTSTSVTTSLSSENLFAFGQSTLQAQAVADLDVLVATLKGKKTQKITVTGHTDRLGSVALNKSLAQKRAAAVKKYLISKGVDKNLIQVEGMGSTQPKTTATQCTGASPSPKLIACLAPDRRVDVKVTSL